MEFSILSHIYISNSPLLPIVTKKCWAQKLRDGLAREMAQPVKCLPRKRKNLSSDAQNSQKQNHQQATTAITVVGGGVLVIPVLGTEAGRDL